MAATARWSVTLATLGNRLIRAGRTAPSDVVLAAQLQHKFAGAVEGAVGVLQAPALARPRFVISQVPGLIMQLDALIVASKSEAGRNSTAKVVRSSVPGGIGLG
jgi:hypothetical protein